jgi:hypothetical protein
MPLRLQFRPCGSVTFRRRAGANAGRLPLKLSGMCNLYSITTNQAAIIALLHARRRRAAGFPLGQTAARRHGISVAVVMPAFI